MPAQVCECAANWRIELVLLTTGEVLKVIVPTSFEFEMVFMEAGRGTISFNRHGVEAFSNRTDPSFVKMAQMYPRAVGIYFSRTAGGTATPDEPTPMFGGILNSFNGSSDGMVTLGFDEIQSYLDYRLIRSDLVFTGVDQRAIAQALVNYASGTNVDGGSVDPIAGPGIQLIGGQGGAGGINRNRTYLGVDRKTLGDALREFMAIIDGPVYSLEHFRQTISNVWTSELLFRNTWFQTSPFPVIAWHHLTDLKFDMDGNELANLVDAFGEPDADGTPLISTFWTGGTIADMPRYDAAPTFDGVTLLSTLSDHAHGYQNDHFDLAGNLQLFLSGLDYGTADGDITLTIDDLRPGNEVSLDIISPHWAIRGGYTIPFSDAQPRIGRLSVAVGLEGPEKVTVQIMEEEMNELVIAGEADNEVCWDCF
jgi:hypothetical protein